MKAHIAKKIIAAVVTLQVLAFPSCGGTTTGNPVIIIEAGGYSPTARWFELISSAYAATTGVRLCFKRLRLKVESSAGSGGTGDIEFTPGEVTLSSSGSSLGEVAIPAGIYRRVEFDFDPACPGSQTGKSISLTNDLGSFSTADTVTIKFEGSFTASNDGQILLLGFQNIISALNQVTASGEIKTRLEEVSVKGTF